MKKIVFRIPATALLAVGLVAICMTPVAWGLPGLQAIYLVPVGLAYWVLRNRTTVDSEVLVARGLFGSTVLPWAEVKAIRLSRKGWLRAVREDDSEVPLPAVRLMHIPALSLISGGRIPDPTAVPAAEPEADAEPAVESESSESAEASDKPVSDKPVSSEQ
ncbi:PH domain-containing protein [Lentzea tibetensis]|uniref:PH domain-containing protein n=1 Tax=Lentzea tibetensis TaxID=2591470 RepID=UPI0016445FF3|nr:PH domain-containing protein [Lentzea tibetensis]